MAIDAPKIRPLPDRQVVRSELYPLLSKPPPTQSYNRRHPWFDNRLNGYESDASLNITHFNASQQSHM